MDNHKICTCPSCTINQLSRGEVERARMLDAIEYLIGGFDHAYPLPLDRMQETPAFYHGLLPGMGLALELPGAKYMVGDDSPQMQAFIGALKAAKQMFESSQFFHDMKAKQLRDAPVAGHG